MSWDIFLSAMQQHGFFFFRVAITKNEKKQNHGCNVGAAIFLLKIIV